MLPLSAELFILLCLPASIFCYIPPASSTERPSPGDEDYPEVQPFGTKTQYDDRKLEELLSSELIGESGLPNEVLVYIGNETFQVPIEDVCQPRKNWSRSVRCEYVKLNSDDCEGGGYLLWVRYVECLEQTGPRVIVIITGVIYMLLMCIMVSTVADDFFSPNVAAIVAHLGMSESVAGVTFMAFGNGAPDIFQSIASILTVGNPKAGLALGSLLGGGLFILLMVIATIVFTSPFKAEPFATVRDLLFYMVACGFILFIFLHDTEVHVWQPAALLGLYLVYVSTVVISQQLYKRKLKQKQKAEEKEVAKARVASSLFETLKVAYLSAHDLLPLCYTNKACEAIEDATEHEKDVEIRRGSSSFSIVDLATCNKEPAACSDELRPEVKIEDRQHSIESIEVIDDKFGDEEEKVEMRPLYTVFITDLLKHLNPIDKAEWRESKWYSKIFMVVKIPCLILFKAFIPHYDNEWSKAVAILHCFLSPIVFLFNIQRANEIPFKHSPGIWAFALGISGIAFIIIATFTTYKREPWIFKRVSCYLGFLMAISFIYFLANEVVGVVTMIGLVTGLSQEFLGLTILAWSNCIGDLVSDIAVVRSGMHKMALAAATGGPLFNLLLGFGVPFLIATARGKTVTISFTPIYHILLLFIAIALCTLLVFFFAQRFQLRRAMAIPLIGLSGFGDAFSVNPTNPVNKNKCFKWSNNFKICVNQYYFE